MKTVAIIQARMTSSRLPGKMLLDLGGKPVIRRVVDHARASGIFDEVVVATSTDGSDDALAAYCEKHGIAVFRGNLDDVLDRYVSAARAVKADIVVRLTGDCPLLDPDVLRDAVTMFTTGDFDYVSNAIERTYPDGLDTEVMSMTALERVHREARLPSEREHVTPYIHKHPELFRSGHLTLDHDLTRHRWTVDEPRDLEFARAIYAHFGESPFDMEEMLEYLKHHPELSALNAEIPTNEGLRKSLAQDKHFRSVLIRTDAHKDLGSGHLMRCLSLAHAMRMRGWAVTFLTCPLISSYEDRVRDAGCHLRIRTATDDARETEQIATEVHAHWIVADSYPFDGAYQDHLKKTGFKILCIDDQAAFDRFEADIILNQNISAKKEWYAEKAPKSRLLLGTDYVLLGPQFIHHKKNERRVRKSMQRILVTFGGGDPKNITLKTLRALEMLAPRSPKGKMGLPQTFSIDVVIGGVNPFRGEVEKYARSMKHPAKIIVDTKDMPALMERADLVISTAGTTTYELLFMEVPFVTGALAKNQKANAEELGRRGLAMNAGWYPDVSEEDLAALIGSLIDDPKKRKELSRRGREIIDGKGAGRVCDAMMQRLTLRPATADDINLIFAWANDPEIRKASFSSGPISMEEHSAWFRKKLADTSHSFFIGMNAEEEPVGQIRFDREKNEATLSIAVAPGQRGKGYGGEFVSLGIAKLEQNIRKIHAYVKPGNAASGKLFEKAGFREIESAEIRGNLARHFILERS